MIVIHFTSALLEIEALLPLLDDLFLIKLFAVRVIIVSCPVGDEFRRVGCDTEAL